jgi:hypothetical protein
MKYEVKLKWGKNLAKWFEVEADTPDEAKRVALETYREQYPGAQAVNVTTVK